jgi:hypothetical protein
MTVGYRNTRLTLLPSSPLLHHPSYYTEKLILRRTNLPNTSSEFWNETTGNQYQAIVNRLKKYESEKNINLTFGEITEQIYWDYFKTINDYQKENNGIMLKH